MAAFEGLQSLFEKPPADSPTLMESLLWNQIKPVNPPDGAAFTEIFGELHFEERPLPADAGPSLHASFSSADVASGADSDSLRSPWLPVLGRSPALDGKDENFGNTGNPSMGTSPVSSGNGGGDCIQLDPLLGLSGNDNSPRGKGTNFQRGHADSFQLCTEGLGSESSDDVEDSRSESSGEHCFPMKEIPAVVDRARGTSAPVRNTGHPRVNWGGRQMTRVEFPPPITY